MLPITSPFDTYRAGLWALRKNIPLAATYLAAMTAMNLLLAAIGTGPGAILSFALLVPLLLISAMLVYPLHATFLSDGRVTGFAAIESFGRMARIAWRLFVIGFLAMVPALMVIIPVAIFLLPDMLLVGELSGEPRAEYGSAGGLYWAAMLALMLSLFGISVILFGPLIPDIVAKNDGKPGPSSFQVGTRHFWRMAANLAAGPGLVLVGYELLQWAMGIGPTDVNAPTAADPTTLLAHLAGLCITCFCSAMTAGVLSDAYRRVLAEDGKPQATAH